MSLVYIKYALIAFGAIVALIVFALAWKMLRPAMIFRQIEYGQSSQTAGKDLSLADLRRLNRARRKVNSNEYLKKVKGGTD
ncbi:MAG: hypothetical protein HN560_12610 [Anaerolineae bacterium]|jgi:hypothetical protein|nr:hypothetical protein [Anaerolineae bacterium]